VIHILLAAFNEETALGEVLNGIARTLADGAYKVWLVDDGSTDGTFPVAETWRGKIPLAVTRHKSNRGLGAALQTGLETLMPAVADDDVLVTLDADNTQPPALIPRLAAPIEAGRADLVIASRFARGARVVGVPPLRRWTARGASGLFRWALPIPGVRDYTCGFRAYRGRPLKEGQVRWGRLISENGFAAQAEILVKLAALSARIEEIPLHLRYDRKPTPSKMPVFRTIQRTLALMVRLRRMN